MSTDDTPVPDDDAIARAARHGLGELAGPAGDLSWDAVQSGARRVRRRRVAAVTGACALVLIAGGSAVAIASSGDGGTPLNVAGPAPSTTRASAPPTGNAPPGSHPGTGCTDCPSPNGPAGASGATGATGTTGPGVPSEPFVGPETGPGGPVDASRGTWIASMAADAAELRVGDTVTVHVTLRNTGDQPQSTQGVAWTIAFGCYGPHAHTSEFVGDAIIQPGAERTFSLEFRPTNDYLGITECSAGLASNRDPNVAGPEDAVNSDLVAISVDFAPGPATTAPSASTTTSAA